MEMREDTTLPKTPITTLHHPLSVLGTYQQNRQNPYHFHHRLTRQYRAHQHKVTKRDTLGNLSPCPRHHHRHSRIGFPSVLYQLRVLLLPGPQLPQVELNHQFYPSTSHKTPTAKFKTHLEFFTFQDISICPTDLSRPTRDRSIKAACSELRFEQVINLGVWSPAFRQPSPGHQTGKN